MTTADEADEVWRRLRADAARNIGQCDAMLLRARTAHKAAMERLDMDEVGRLGRLIDDLLEVRHRLSTAEREASRR